MTKIFGVILAMLGFFLVSTSPAAAADAPTGITVGSDGLTISVTFDRWVNLSDSAAQDYSRDMFTVKVGGDPFNIASVSALSDTVTISLSSGGGGRPIFPNETVTVSYDGGDFLASQALNFVKDTNGNVLSPALLVPPFTDVSATNNSAVGPPALSTDVPPLISEDRLSIVLTFDQAMFQNYVPNDSADGSSLTITADGSSVAFAGITIANTQAGLGVATVPLSAVLPTSASVTVAYDYTAGCRCFGNQYNQWVEDFTATNIASAPQVAPQLASATVETNGTLLSLSFDETLAATTPAAGTITVVAGSSAVAVASIANDDDTSVLTLASAIAQGATVKVSYDAPDSGGYQDAAGNLVADFTDISATNNSTVAASTDGGSSGDSSSGGGSSTGDGSSGDSSSGGGSSDSGATTTTTAPATVSTTPSLVTEANQEALTAAAGSVKLIVNGEEVEMTLSSTGANDAGATDPENRTAAQITELQDAADGIVERLDAAAGGDSGLTVVDTETGAEIEGIFEDTRVPVEDVIVAEADEFSGLYASRDEDGNPNKIRAEVLEMERGGEVAVYVYGLPAGESAELVLMSTPYLLGTATADSNGNFTKILSPPEAILAGTHTLVTASETLSVSLGIKITEPAADVTLPATGGSDMSTTPVLLVVLVGAFFTVLARRRQQIEN